MYVDAVKTWVVGNPPPAPGSRYFIFVKLTTDDGIVGYGEAYNATFDPHLTAKMIEDLAARYLYRRDPHDVEVLFRSCYSSGFSQRPDVSVMGCLSALEMACWDIIGKVAGRPVHQLLGGRVHETLRSYTYLYPQTGSVVPDEADGADSRNVYNDPDLAAEAAAACVQQGFDAVKFDPAGPYTIHDGHMPTLADIERSAEMCRAIRAAVGSSADLLFGTHGQLSLAGALRMARAIEPYDPLWFEEPVPPDSPEVMAQVARATTVPVATGERLTTRFEFARVLAAGAASIIQPNAGRVGGVFEMKKVAAMAETHQVQLAPHCYCGPLVAAANIQVAVTSPNFLILESIMTWDGFHAELLHHEIEWEDGHVIPSTAPGLGVELDEAVCDAHPWTGDELHLEMAPRPWV